MRVLILCLCVFISITDRSSAGENWSHWRGPTGNGVSATAKPPIEFSSSKNVVWKRTIPGRGSSSPVVWDDQIFVTSAVPAQNQGKGNQASLEFKLFCINRNNGEVLWERVATVATPHEGTHQTNGYASASPCTDGSHVYAHFGSRGLYCYSMKGELKWKRDDFGKMSTMNQFGEGSSPTLADDRIIVPWDHNGPSALYALNKSTGKTIWRVNRDEPTCWATPLIVENDGQKQIIMNGQKFARSYDLDSGHEIWRCGGQMRRPVASPAFGDGVVYIGSGLQGAFMGAFRLKGKGDIQGTDQVVWTLDHDTPDIASPLLTPTGRLYFFKGKSGLFSCIDARTAKPYFLAKRIGGIDTTYASPVFADGKIYLSGRSGVVAVIKDSETLELLSSNQMEEVIDATPALVDDQIIIRGEAQLFCIRPETTPGAQRR